MAYNILNKNSMGANTYVADTVDDMLGICMKTDLPIGTKCIHLNIDDGNVSPRGLYLWSPNSYIIDKGPQFGVLSKDQKVANLKDFKATDVFTEKYQQNPQELVVIIPGQWQLIEPLGGIKAEPEGGVLRHQGITIGGFDDMPVQAFSDPEHSIVPLAGSLIPGDSPEGLSFGQKIIDQINAQTPFGMIIRIPGYAPQTFNPGHVS